MNKNQLDGDKLEASGAFLDDWDGGRHCFLNIGVRN